MMLPQRSVEPFFTTQTRLVTGNMPYAHFHDTYEIYYLISGTRRHLVKHDMFDVYPGDFVLIPSMTIHQTLNVPNRPDGDQHTRYLISAPRELIPDVFVPLFDTYHHRIPDAKQPAILDCFAELSENANRKDAFAEASNRACLVRILTILARCPAEIHAHPLPDSSAHVIRQASIYIKEHCGEPLTLESVAKEFHFSREYFSTLFKSVTGFGFNYYLNQMRISKASMLLLTTDLSVSEISRQCGFRDSNYFSAVFKRNLSVTPLQFRHQESIPKE